MRAIEMYFRIRQLWPIWFYIVNRKPRNHFQKNSPALTSVQKRIVRELTETGIAIAHIDELFPGENLLARFQAYTRELRDKAEVKTSKTFLLNLWETRPPLDFQNSFVKLSCSNTVLNIVNSYMEMWARFYVFTLNVTMPVGEKADAFASQRWHRDPEDKKQCKFFLYLTDVDRESGPFIYVTKSHYQGTYGSLFPRNPPAGVYPKDGEVERAIPNEDIKICTGKAGTVIFCDTGGLHRGGYAIKNERIMFTSGYYSSASVWRTLFSYSADLAAKLHNVELCEEAKWAITFNSNRFSARLLHWYKGARGD